LQAYKFGKSVTLAGWSRGYEPKDAYFVIEENKKRGLHTLVFLDIKEGKCMEAKEAVELLEETERRKKKGVIASETQMVAISSLGRKEQKISFGEIEKLKKAELGKSPSILIFPAKLHFLEEEWLNYFKL